MVNIVSVGERITQLRKEQNISQVQLAKALEVSRQAVSKWENDQSIPDMVKLIQLADLLKTDTEYLATGRHSTIKEPPSIVTVVEKVDNVVERVIEKPVVVEKIVEVEVEKIVEVERVIEKVIEVPRIKKVTRVKYLRNPLEFAVVGIFGFALGILIGLLL